MGDNWNQWDAWKDVEDKRSRQKGINELNYEGYEYYQASDYRRAADCFQQAAELGQEQGDVDSQCENLLWEGYCYSLMNKLRIALARLLLAEHLNGGTAEVRFNIVSELFDVGNRLPLPKKEQAALLKRLSPYKSYEQFGGSKSIVLQWEGLFLSCCGNKHDALNSAQEALVCDTRSCGPGYDDCYYYLALVKQYCENGLIEDAWTILRDWREYGSTQFAKTKSWQFRAKAQLLYVEGRLEAAWDSIQCCQAEEQYLNIYGQVIETLAWIIQIAVDTGRMDEARVSLPLLFRFHNADSLYQQYDCFYWFAYYYAGLAAQLYEGGAGRRYDTPETAAYRAARWFARTEHVGKELDKLLETDVKRKELDNLRVKLSEAGIWEEKI